MPTTLISMQYFMTIKHRNATVLHPLRWLTFIIALYRRHPTKHPAPAPHDDGFMHPFPTMAWMPFDDDNNGDDDGGNGLDHVTSHHITAHHGTSHHITSRHITSRHIASHHITSHYIMRCVFHWIPCPNIIMSLLGSDTHIVSPSIFFCKGFLLLYVPSVIVKDEQLPMRVR